MFGIYSCLQSQLRIPIPQRKASSSSSSTSQFFSLGAPGDCDLRPAFLSTFHSVQVS
nr:hypothetical protein Q903MT_gene1556 [Picea sitchensis]